VKTKLGVNIMHWYAYFVETGKEDYIKNNIDSTFDSDFLRCLVPKRKIPEKKNGHSYEVVKPIFPGYILVNTKMNFNTYYKLKEIPRLYELLNYRGINGKKSFEYEPKVDEQDKYFRKINEDEITVLLKLLNKEDVLEFSKIILMNSKVTVKSGPLKNMESIIKKIDKHKNRAKISLGFLNSERTIDVGIDII
jgi:transcriptional antiterminator NusG